MSKRKWSGLQHFSISDSIDIKECLEIDVVAADAGLTMKFKSVADKTDSRYYYGKLIRLGKTVSRVTIIQFAVKIIRSRTVEYALGEAYVFRSRCSDD